MTDLLIKPKENDLIVDEKLTQSVQLLFFPGAQAVGEYVIQHTAQLHIVPANRNSLKSTFCIVGHSKKKSNFR